MTLLCSLPDEPQMASLLVSGGDGIPGCLLCWPREVQSSIRVAKESWGSLSSDCRANRPHLGLCPEANVPLQGRKGSRGCIPDAPGETGIHLEWKQRTPLCSRVATVPLVLWLNNLLQSVVERGRATAEMQERVHNPESFQLFTKIQVPHGNVLQHMFRWKMRLQTKGLLQWLVRNRVCKFNFFFKVCLPYYSVNSTRIETISPMYPSPWHTIGTQ